MSKIPSDKMPEEFISIPDINTIVTQEKPIMRRSSTCTPMCEYKRNPTQPLVQHVHMANSAISRLSSGTRVISPHQRAALGINTNTITPEPESMIHTAIQKN